MQERKKLINEYAKRVIKKLQQDYPIYSWYLTIKNEKEVMIGCDNQGRAVVIGSTYEDIVNTLSLNITVKD